MSAWLMLVSGFEGIPLPYSPRTDDVIALVLLACFFFSSFALARSKKFLSQQAKDFMLHRERTSIFAASTAADVRYLLLLVFQTCILSGICIFNYFNDVQPTLMEKVSPPLLLGIYILICLLYLLLKWLFYSFLGWVFFDKNRTTIWLESYSTLLVYFDLNILFLVSIGLFLIIFAKILMFYKWIKLFFDKISSLFLLILYFCALEIMPYLLLYQGLRELNNILVIKI